MLKGSSLKATYSNYSHFLFYFILKTGMGLPKTGVFFNAFTVNHLDVI